MTAASSYILTFVAMAVIGAPWGVHSSSVRRTPQEQRLMTDLFRNYSAIVRPVANKTDIVVVTCDAALQTISNFNQKQQFIMTNLWLRLSWEDHYLRWNPEDYEGIDSLVVKAGMIWKPDITLHRNRNPRLSGMSYSAPLLTSAGVVYWNFPTNFKSPCKIDASYFPFDEQRCKLTFGSWAYNANLLRFALRHPSGVGDISTYQDNGIMELLGMLLEVHTDCYTFCATWWSDFEVTIVLRRRPLFYLSNLLIPCLLLWGITLFSFLLPADSGEKVSLMVTILLSLIVFMLQLSNSVPSTAEGIPLMEQYTAVTIGIISVSVVLTVCVLRIHHRPGVVAPVPGWLKRLSFAYLAPILIVRLPFPNPGRLLSLPSTPSGSRQGKEKEGSQSESNLQGAVTSIDDEMKYLASISEKQKRVRDIVSEWKHVGKVFDRLVLVVYLITSLVFAMIFVFQPIPQTSAEDIEKWYSRA